MHARRNSYLRKKVFERDHGFCAICGRFDAKFESDHIIALWCGGSDTLENLQSLCRACHMRKTVGETPIRAKTDRLRDRDQLTKRRRSIS